ncbi:trehalose-phosphatase [Sphingomonas turrisvirgatae]|uniref:Trehalose 6-phosphate phosphatase n=1 Tax=Sphingomonas turrisvirgatae TaxID=1888892 RepID=A0A1E3LXF2_9SPHN|nr:trehalose-phosphatase [Sphingomonas turrisvirgatae]ODP37835.1 trehalose-phosphatase [Sphingomonas turrisvirgatae]
MREPPRALLRDASLLLDFDGTLVEIAATPEAVRVPVELTQLIGRLHDALDGRVALITGRPARAVSELIGYPVHVVGSHGVEFAWADRPLEVMERPAALDEVLARMRAFAADHPGVLVEEKPLGAALHFRNAPAAEAACLDLATTLAREAGLQLQAGKMMSEARAGGGDKGSAVRRIMAEPGFAGTRPVFLGDDVTDEAGFVAAAALGGAGILVGDPRETAATHRLPDVAAVRGWLASSIEVTA